MTTAIWIALAAVGLVALLRMFSPGLERALPGAPIRVREHEFMLHLCATSPFWNCDLAIGQERWLSMRPTPRWPTAAYGAPPNGAVNEF